MSCSSWQQTPEADDSLSIRSGSLTLLRLKPEDQQIDDHKPRNEGLEIDCICYTLHTMIVEISNWILTIYFLC